MNRTFIIGTRGSELAKKQTQIVIELLREKLPNIKFEQRIIKTTGDRILDVALSKIGDKGLFVKEIETALLNQDIDIAVHSYKDLPTESPDELVIAAVPERAKPFDLLVTRDGSTLDGLPENAEVFTSSLRRRAQLLAARPDISVLEIRGNVETRLNKFYKSDKHGIILAQAGLERLNISDHAFQVLPFYTMLPAPAQGALAVQVRRKDEETLKVVRAINNAHSEICVHAERAFLHRLEGGCQTPVAALCQDIGGNRLLIGRVLSLDGSQSITGRRLINPKSAEQDGRCLAEDLLQRKAADILEGIRAKQE